MYFLSLVPRPAGPSRAAHKPWPQTRPLRRLCAFPPRAAATMTSTGGDVAIYRPKDAISSAATATMITGAAGLFTSAVQNTLQKQNIGPWGVFTRTGGTIAMFAGMGGAYMFVKDASANLRERDDHWNAVWGAFASGSIMGLRSRTFPALLGWGATVAVTVGVFEYTGGTMRGFGTDPDVDEFERRETMRKNYRSPGWETLAELGEGRGIKGPGYAERRRERIKENYGIDVPETHPSTSP